MKNLLILCIALLSVTMQAQRPGPEGREGKPEGKERMERPNFTPEQIADLKTKAMVLQLDLNESQTGEMYKIQLDLAQKRKTKREARKEEGKKRSELTTDDIYKAKSAALDEQIELKNKLRSLLTDDQFEKLEKMSTRRGKMRGHRGHRGDRHGRKGPKKR